MSFRDRVVVITGASSGIGRALALRLSQEGCKLGLIARRGDLLRQVANAIELIHGQCAIATADVSDRRALRAAMQQIRQQLGPIDCLIANAGVGTPTLIDPMNIEDIETMVRVNFLGVVYSIEAVLPDMLARRQGHIAAVSSLAGFQGLPGESGYCASKAAVNTFLDGLRVQLRDYSIAVTTICPGFVRTPMTESNRFEMPWEMEADDAAERIVTALRKRAKVFRFPWQTSWLVRFSSWLPDRLLARAMRRYNEDPPMNVITKKAG